MDEKKSVKMTLGTVICIIIIVLLVISLICTISYYKNKNKKEVHKPITVEAFKKFIDTKGFNVVDALDYLQSSTFKDGLKAGYITQKNDDKEFQVNFFEFKDEVHTVYAYCDEIISIEKNNTGEFTENNEMKVNYAKYTAFSNGYYNVMIRIDNTLLFAKIQKDQKETVDNLLKDLGY